MVFKSFVGAMCAGLLSVAGHPAVASVIYTYTGSSYTTATAPYDQTMTVNVSIELESELTNNLNAKHFYPISFRFSDGLNTITQNTEHTGGYFQFSTDNNGTITGWGVAAGHSFSDDSVVGDVSLQIGTWFFDQLFFDTDSAIMSPCDGTKYCDLFQASYAYTWAPGIWALTAVPVPATVWLFGSGLLCLIGTARRKGRV